MHLLWTSGDIYTGFQKVYFVACTILRFTSGATPAELLMTSMAVFLIHLLFQPLVGLELMQPCGTVRDRQAPSPTEPLRPIMFILCVWKCALPLKLQPSCFGDMKLTCDFFYSS